MPEDPGGGWIDSWTYKSKTILEIISDAVAAMQCGAASQGQGNGETRALLGEFVGKIGPLLGEYRAERIVREF